MDPSFRVRLKFWGVRGSVPTPRVENLGCGGNTPCVELRLPDGEIFILDAGTGICDLGNFLVRESSGSRLSLHCFLTHYHWDHIQGIPYFSPLYSPRNEVSFHCFRSPTGMRDVLANQMQSPYFPVPFDLLPARKHLIELGNSAVMIGDLTIYPFPINHPHGARGYRIERKGAAIVYATDVEHGNKGMDDILRKYSRDADILIYDAHFTPEEYELHKGWGHSTWREGTRLACEAGVKQLILFHHHPSRDDQACSRLAIEAAKQFKETVLAKEGDVFAV